MAGRSLANAEGGKRMTTQTTPKHEGARPARKRNRTRSRSHGHAQTTTKGLSHAHTPGKAPDNMAAALAWLAEAGHDLASALREASGVRHGR
jgi:hypothetical protein